MRLLIVGGILSLAVSASLTPASAFQRGTFGHGCGGTINCLCQLKCDSGSARVRLCTPGAFCDINIIPPASAVCITKCANSKEAARQ
jgi:hypothetical protein